MINRILFFGLSVLLIGCFFVVFGLDLDRATLQRFSGFTMGTSYEIQLVTDRNSIDIKTVEENVADLLRRLDREIFSTYSPTSELTQLNMTPVTEVFSASRELIEVLVLSEEIRALTDGAFDISINPLVNLWGFGAQSERIVSRLPTQLEIDDAMARMGAEYLVINESNLEVVKTKDIQIDLSGVAKGYAVDEVAVALEDFNIDSYFIEVGGEIKLKGFKPNSEEWLPAIEAPAAGTYEIYEVLSSRGEAFSLAGSGDYRNYFEIDGARYSHEIDPRTGRPVTHDLAAAFVITESAAEADALATAFMILGLKESKSVIDRHSISAFLISRVNENHFEHFVTSTFAQYVLK